MGLTATTVGFLLLGMLVPRPAIAADVAVGLYFGKAFAMPGDVTVRRRGGRQDTYGEVIWYDESFTSPFYYSVRLIYWPDTDSNNGIALDFTHAKLYSNLRDRITVTHSSADGTRQTQQSLGDSFSRLAFSHGYNLLSLNMLHRSPAQNHDSHNEASIYVGAGIGVAVPHVEIQLADTLIDHYKAVGLVFQGMIGITLGTETDLPLNAEYKYSYGNGSIELADDSTLEFSPQLHHFSVGPVIKQSKP